MGQILSAEQEQVSEVVLVPPLFERDHKGRSRMAKSSYDFLFCKAQLKWLFNDYLRPGGRSLLHFSPAEDPRMSITARLRTDIERERLGQNSAGAATIRFQASPVDPLSFIDVKAAVQGGGARLRGCYFNPASCFGAFVELPIADAEAYDSRRWQAATSTPLGNGDGARGAAGSVDVCAGLRYSSPVFSAGVMGSPLDGGINALWMVGRHGAMMAGLQVRPGASGCLSNPRALSGAEPGRLWGELRGATSLAVAYSPAAGTPGRGAFTTALELQEQQRLVLSFMHHMAVQRLCKNPFEDEQVVGVTNYINIGLQVVTQLRNDGSFPSDGVASKQRARDPVEPSLRLGASWQVNKNWLAKVLVGTDAAVAALAFKAWWQPSFTLAANAGWDYKKRSPRFGLVLNVENYGNIRYERFSGAQRLQGSALVQRHAALPEDLANKAGRGLLVQKKDLDNPAILGQTQPESAKYL
ncbi:hypothetical protein WJX81_004859 [Elliptochloris bilobata]|uniref:Uncharacterized protein n=1 Tax=Elliptochloris bilobata TaxID=381761 RepID=A0AAW1RXJ8_9CHLO